MENDYIFPDSKCPMCSSHYEDVGTEEIKGKWLITFCSQCGYVFKVI